MTNTEIPALLDRQAFERQLDDLVTQEAQVTLGHLDIDNFKAVNDALGHGAGDRLIDALRDLLVGLAEKTDGAAGRIGGDEFAIVFPGTPLEAGFLHLEQLRARAAEAFAALLPAEIGGGRSISAGVASYPRDTRTVAGLLTRADQALWQAKEAGRNQVALPSPEEMVLKSNYYTPAQLGRLKRLAEGRKQKESVLLREALDDLLRKYDVKPDVNRDQPPPAAALHAAARR